MRVDAIGLCCALFGWSVLLAAPSMAAPSRIVSINLCADQLLLSLANRESIISLSQLADEPRSSALAAKVGDIPTNSGRAEEIILLEPDLILAGSYSERPVVELLRGLGFQVIEVPIARDIAAIKDNLRLVGAAIGEDARAAATIKKFDERLRDFQLSSSAKRPLAALFWAGGVTSGRDTLAGDVLATAGFDNLASKLSYEGMTPISLEQLLLAAPDIVIMGHSGGDATSLSDELFEHAVFQKSDGKLPALTIPDNLWACGSPQIVDAIAKLVEARLLFEGELQP